MVGDITQNAVVGNDIRCNGTDHRWMAGADYEGTYNYKDHTCMAGAHIDGMCNYIELQRSQVHGRCK